MEWCHAGVAMLYNKKQFLLIAVTKITWLTEGVETRIEL